MMATHWHVSFLTTCDSIGHTVRFALPKGGIPALIRNFRRQQGIVDAVVRPCTCATPDVAPPDPLADVDPAELAGLAEALAAAALQLWQDAHPETAADVA